MNPCQYYHDIKSVSKANQRISHFRAYQDAAYQEQNVNKDNKIEVY